LQANGNLETNVRYGQKVKWSCLVQSKNDQHKKPCGLVLKELIVWPIFIVKMIFVLCFFDWVLVMKLIRAMTCLKFLLLAKFIQILLSTPLS
jgi:hypothetical protein